MRVANALASILLVAGCDSGSSLPANHSEGKTRVWNRGESVSADGAQFSIYCLHGEWDVTVKTIERLVAPDAEFQWVNRDVFYKFDNGAELRTKGTLNENRLDLNQAQEGSTVGLNYGQDVAAGLMRGNHKTLTIRTTDGSSRPKQWRFDIEGSGGDIPNDDISPCPAVGSPSPSR